LACEGLLCILLYCLGCLHVFIYVVCICLFLYFCIGYYKGGGTIMFLKIYFVTIFSLSLQHLQKVLTFVHGHHEWIFLHLSWEYPTTLHDSQNIGSFSQSIKINKQMNNAYHSCSTKNRFFTTCDMSTSTKTQAKCPNIFELVV
jgi:hypothetical protein